jgi:hypothetical protein
VKGPAISAAMLIGLYVLSQWLSRTLSERLFAHVLRLPVGYRQPQESEKQV